MANDQFYERLNAIERLKLALARHVAGHPFEAAPEDLQALLDEYDRLRTTVPTAR